MGHLNSEHPPPTTTPLPQLTAKKKVREQRREREEGEKRGSGLALSPPCLPTSRGMSLEGFKVPGFGSITVFPIDLSGKAEGEGASEPRCVNS